MHTKTFKARTLKEAEEHRLLLLKQGVPKEALATYDEANKAAGLERAYRVTLSILEESKSPTSYALDIHARLGEWDKAVEYLQQAVASHDPALVLILPHPLLDPMRSHPGYVGMMQAMRL